MLFNNLSNREKNFLLVGLIVIISIVGYFNLYLPQVEAIEEKESELNNKLNELKVKQELSQRRKQIEKEYKILKEKVDEVEGEFFQRGEEFKLVEIVNNLAAKWNIELLNIESNELSQEKIYTKIPVTVLIEGEYNDILNFLAEFESSEYVIRIHNLNLRSEFISADSIEVELELLGYSQEVLDDE